MKKEITIKIENETETAPLYKKYDRQHNPQPAYIEIDPRGETIEISAWVSDSIGTQTCSPDQWNNLTCTIGCPPEILGPALEDCLNSEWFKGKVYEIYEGFEEFYNGQNYKGRWNEDRDQLVEEVESHLLSLDMAQILDPAEWIEESLSLYNEDGEEDFIYPTTGIYDIDGMNIDINRKNITAIVEDAESYLDPNQILEYPIEDYLESLIDDMENNK